MISGPTPPHPRVLLAALLAEAEAARAARRAALVDPSPAGTFVASALPAVLEAGLAILHRGLNLGDDLVVDFLCRDAAGHPVTVLCFDAEDAEVALPRVLDTAQWFAENRGLCVDLWDALRADLAEPPRPPLWDRELRIFVVGLGLSPRFHRRLAGLGPALADLAVYRLSSLFVNGQRRWFAEGVDARAGGRRSIALPSAPEGLAVAELAELAERLLGSLSRLSPDVQILGDRFHRELQLDGRPLLRLCASERLLAVEIVAGARGVETLELAGPADLDRAVDRVLRGVVGEFEPYVPRARAESRAPEAPRRPTPKVAGLGGDDLAAARLSEEELSAFL